MPPIVWRTNRHRTKINFEFWSENRSYSFSTVGKLLLYFKKGFGDPGFEQIANTFFNY